ncbi:MAG: hypothetical protein KA118_00510 [Verrucomicrobia bacterium]|nr:hypothetical protein [Verrucomicrobiota bacterium]
METLRCLCKDAPPSCLLWQSSIRLGATTAGTAVLLLAVCMGSRAQEVIEAKDYSGFLKGDGDGWHGASVPVL